MTVRGFFANVSFLAVFVLVCFVDGRYVPRHLSGRAGQGRRCRRPWNVSLPEGWGGSGRGSGLRVGMDLQEWVVVIVEVTRESGHRFVGCCMLH